MFESKPLQFDVVVILTKTTTWINIEPFHGADGKQFLCRAMLSVHISFECVILNTRYSFHIRSGFHSMKLHHNIYFSVCVCIVLSFSLHHPFLSSCISLSPSKYIRICVCVCQCDQLLSPSILFASNFKCKRGMAGCMWYFN